MTKIADVKERIRRIKNQLSKEEYSYIQEAINCLVNDCFKAATLMIWAGGISRIFSHVENNRQDFLKASQDMKAKPTGVYRYHATSFVTKADSADDIRIVKDKQLVCYLKYKGIINNAQSKLLLQHYETRCMCAHPTELELKRSGVINIFENIYEFILSNKSLQ